MSLKQKIDIFSERNSLAIRKSEKMVVIQHRVQRLDPLRNKKSERNREIDRESERVRGREKEKNEGTFSRTFKINKFIQVKDSRKQAGRQASKERERKKEGSRNQAVNIKIIGGPVMKKMLCKMQVTYKELQHIVVYCSVLQY